MAILNMKKLILVGYGKDKSKVLKGLHKLGCVEVSKTSNIENTCYKEETNQKDVVLSKLNKLDFAFDFLKAEKRKADFLVKKKRFSYDAGKKQVLKPTPYFKFDDFNKIVKKESELFDEIKNLEDISSKYAVINSEITKLENLIEQVEIFKPIACKLNVFHDTKYTSIVLGAIPKTNLAGVEQIKADFPMMYAEVSESTKFCPVVIVALKEDIDAVLSRFNDLEFVKTSFNYDMTAKEKVEEADARIKVLEAEKMELLKESMGKLKYLDDMQQLFDYYTIEKAKLKASDGFALTKSCFVLEGWFPERDEKKVRDTLYKISKALIIETRKAVEGEVVPTLVENSKIVAPYQSITNMYSVPSMHDIDPNPFVAVFYFAMFGLMMGDAIYGIILAVSGFWLYKKLRPAPGGKGNIMLIIAMGGISTFIWGIFLGGWMGLPIEGTFLEKAVWFNPIDPKGSITMLLLSLGIGFFQIIFSMGIKAYSLFREGHWFDVICDIFSWYLFFIGLILVAVAKFANVPSLKLPGIIVMLVGLGIIIVFGGRKKKGFGKVLGGFGELYGGVNFMSDILSYSRIFGLGLATCVIAFVINKICGVIIELIPPVGGVPIFGYILAAPIFIVGHVFNIAINTLGTYIHNARLQFIEFFSRFYDGGGHMFMPLGSNTKYTYINK